jgi:hypothetical protein
MQFSIPDVIQHPTMMLTAGGFFLTAGGFFYEKEENYDFRL